MLPTASLAERARAILAQNDRGTHTVPSGHLYPHQWAWDSGFAAIGWAHVDPARAVTELETLMAGRWADGRVPHIVFNRVGEGTYFPDETFWETQDRAVPSSSITQPPNWALAARRVLELGGDPARIKALLPAIDASHRFFAAQRDPLGWGCVAVVHPWESGLDNSPVWDAPMQAIDPRDAPPFKRVDVEKVDDPGERPSHVEYQRYAVLVKAIAAQDFGPGPFAVYSPLMTSILARSEADLAWLGAELGVETAAAARAERLRAGIEAHLWDPASGRCRYYDAVGGIGLTPDVIGAYGPLIINEPMPGRDGMIETLKSRYWTACPLPSTAPGEAGFDQRRYWRGPAWVNMNWLYAPAVGRALADATLERIEREGFREYYDCHTGEGLGARTFTWTAALALDWLVGG